MRAASLGKIGIDATILCHIDRSNGQRQDGFSYRMIESDVSCHDTATIICSRCRHCSSLYPIYLASHQKWSAREICIWYCSFPRLCWSFLRQGSYDNLPHLELGSGRMLWTFCCDREKRRWTGIITVSRGGGVYICNCIQTSSIS